MSSTQYQECYDTDGNGCVELGAVNSCPSGFVCEGSGCKGSTISCTGGYIDESGNCIKY